MTSSNGNIFRVTGPLCGEFTGLRWIPLTKASDAELWYFLDLCPNKRLSKQWWGWWFETLSCSLWRHSNGSRQNCHNLVEYIFKCIYLNENVWISLTISLKSVLKAPINTLRPRQNEHHFADDIFKCIFLNENVWIPVKISLKYVHKGPVNNIPALVQIMAWRRSGDKPLSEPMMAGLPTHICVSRPQWVNNIPALLTRRKTSIWRLVALSTPSHYLNHKATSHYLNQWWFIYWRIYVSLGLNELKCMTNKLHAS